MTLKPIKAVAGIVLTSAMIAGGQLHADLTAAEYLDEMKRNADSVGAVLEWETIEETGNGKLLRGYSLEFSQPGIEASVYGDWLRLTETGDGYVSIEYPEEFDLKIDVANEFRFTGTLSLEGGEFLASRDSRLKTESRTDKIVLEGTFKGTFGDVIGSLLVNLEGYEETNLHPSDDGGPELITTQASSELISIEVLSPNSNTRFAANISGFALDSEFELPKGWETFGAELFPKGEFPLGAFKLAVDSFEMTMLADNEEIGFTAFYGVGPMHFAMSNQPDTFSVDSSESDTKIFFGPNGAGSYSAEFAAVDWTFENETQMESQEVRSRLDWEIEGIRLGPDTLAQLDPSGLIPNPPGGFTGEVSVTVPSKLWAALDGYSDATEFAAELLGSDVDVALDLDRAELFGISLSANGNLNYQFDNFAAFGTLIVELGGAQEFVATANKAGLVGDELQGFLSLLLGIGRQLDDGNLVYEVEFLGPEGVAVNGINF